MEKKAYRFIGTRSAIAGKGGFRRYGQKFMLTDAEADSFVFRRGGVPAVPDADWEKEWKRCEVQLPGSGKVGVEAFDQPSSHQDAPESFSSRKSNLAGLYNELVASAAGKRAAKPSVQSQPAAPAPAPPLPKSSKDVGKEG